MAYIVYQETIEYLKKIADFSHEQSQITLEKVGMEIRDVLIAKARSYPKDKTSFYRYKYQSGSHRYMRLKSSSQKRNPYERYEGNVRIDESEPDKLKADMADLIRSKPYHELGKVIIGWMDTASYKTKIGKARIAGTKTEAIGKKLEFGGTIAISERSQRMRWYSGYKGGGRSIRMKAYPVINPSFGTAQSSALKKAKEEYIKLMEKYNGNQKLRSA